MSTITLSTWLSKAVRKRALGQAVDNAKLSEELASAGMSNTEFDQLVSESRREIHSQRQRTADEANVARQELVAVQGNRLQAEAKLKQARTNGIEQAPELIEQLQAEFAKHSAREAELTQHLEASERELQRLRA